LRLFQSAHGDLGEAAIGSQVALTVSLAAARCAKVAAVEQMLFDLGAGPALHLVAHGPAQVGAVDPLRGDLRDGSMTALVASRAGSTPKWTSGELSTMLDSAPANQTDSCQQTGS
jgi:hypothetical protein